MELPEDLPECWRVVLSQPSLLRTGRQLQTFLDRERAETTVFPPAAQTFRALQMTPLSEVRVVITGQDPYHDHGQAEGLSFSVPPGIRIPPSLRNIFRELEEDEGRPISQSGCLDGWAAQGVLLLNTVLTVRAHQANSHRRQGWEDITAEILRAVNELPNVVFILWGAAAGKLQPELHSRHLVLTSAHPSPLSARRGFFGSRPFSQANRYLLKHGLPPIDWLQTTSRGDAGLLTDFP